MKLKQLESLLGTLQQFEKPKIELEQYPTGAHIASRMLFEVHTQYNEIEDLSIADFGCGCGTLGIGASALGASSVIGLDTDPEALRIASLNCQETEESMDLILTRIQGHPLKEKSIDVVLMNPPFGTRQKGADMEFLQEALRVATVAVYSLHKSSTRKHIETVTTNTFGAASAEVLFQLRYDLPKIYSFHKKKEVDIEVDLWRFQVD